MKVEIATCPCSWGVFWPDGSPSGVPYNVFLDQAAEAGYIGIELGPVGYLPTDPKILKYELSSRGLIARAGTACYKIDEMRSFEDVRDAAIDLCARLKAFDVKYLVMMDESPLGRDPQRKKEADPERILKNYNIIGEYVKFAKDNYDVTVVYHPHARSIVETEEEILKLMDITGCMLCFDTGHHQLVNGKPEKGDRCAIDFFLKYHERIPFLHFKNVNGEAMKERLVNPASKIQAFCPLEEGIIDFVDFKKALESVNFNGIGVVEQDMAHAPAEESLKLSKKNREFLMRVGIVK
ncbi:MAG TPA: TIM barrel protein [Clostridiaceae bacterium]|nr:TIM barrel protein [Clostridiaceae bacterium]